MLKNVDCWNCKGVGIEYHVCDLGHYGHSVECIYCEGQGFTLQEVPEPKEKRVWELQKVLRKRILDVSGSWTVKQ